MICKKFEHYYFMNYSRYFKLICLASLVSLSATAQTYKDTLKLNKPIQKVYKFNDNLFWGMSVGASYSMSEFVRKEPFFTMISPHVDFEFGKHWNKWFATRVMLGYHSQRASCDSTVTSYFPQAKAYTFSMVSGYFDAMICLDRLFTRYSTTEKHQLWAFGGAGGMFCFGYSKRIEDWNEFYPINTDPKVHFAWRVGLEWQYKVSKSTSLVLRGVYATTHSAYDGKELESSSSRHFAEVSLGFNVHLGNRYGQRCFENCGHNANRYFNVMNYRLAKLHKKINKRLPESFRAEANVGLTESDSILLFPRDYFFVTDMQKSKLYRMAKYLNAHPDQIAHIHIYPDAGNVGSMELEFRVKNRSERVREILTNEIKLASDRYIITTHPNEQSPYPRQHIFTLGGIIKYENRY